MDFLRSWITGVTAAAMLVALVLVVTPKGTVRNIVLLGGGLVLALAVIGPLLSVDTTQLAQWDTAFQMNYDRAEAAVSGKGEEVMKKIIQERTGAYIVNKSQALGLSLSAAVSAEVPSSGGYPIPTSVSLTLEDPALPELRHTLSVWIASECGIPADAQSWIAGE